MGGRAEMAVPCSYRNSWIRRQVYNDEPDSRRSEGLVLGDCTLFSLLLISTLLILADIQATT